MKVTQKRKSKANKDMFIEEFRKTDGNIFKACKAVPMERKNYYRWMEKDKGFAQQVDDVCEEMNDKVQGKIMDEIDLGNDKVMMFWAKTKMKHRGFVERTEQVIDANVRTYADDVIEAWDRVKREKAEKDESTKKD